MSFTSGFFNSVEGDRKYNAEQMSAIFDGVINDGIFMNIGTAFVVTADTGRNIIIGKGRAWFNSTWIYNDAPFLVQTDVSELLLDRYDAVVLEVDHSDSVREGTVRIIKGTPASNPAYPELTHNVDVHQYPLAYIYRKANSTEITQADIRNMVGSEETPFVTGILETISLNKLLGQWDTELDLFVKNKEYEFNEWFEEMMKTTDFESWAENEKMIISDWFDEIKGKLSMDQAVNLQFQIDDMEDRLTNIEQNTQTKIDKSEIENILMNGFSECTKEFSDDGLIIISVAPDGRRLIKTFTNGLLTITIELKDIFGNNIGKLVKNISSDSKTISSELTIY